jgi:hypothetical protein
MFELNPNMQIRLKNIGHENTSILVVDDFFADYTLAVEEAINANYSTRKEDIGEFYPGMRAPLRKDYGLPILQFSARTLHKHLGLANNMQVAPINANYSLLTKKPEQMQLQQCIPHFDTSELHCFAILHYMNQGDFGGTGFYRHKATGYENITRERERVYLSALQTGFKKDGMPKQQYFCDSDEHFELIHKEDYRKNRLVAYPTSILHTAYVDNPQRDVIADPRTGRLSSNFLFKFQ